MTGGCTRDSTCNRSFCVRTVWQRRTQWSWFSAEYSHDECHSNQRQTVCCRGRIYEQHQLCWRQLARRRTVGCNWLSIKRALGSLRLRTKIHNQQHWQPTALQHVRRILRWILRTGHGRIWRFQPQLLRYARLLRLRPHERGRPHRSYRTL